MKKGVDLKKIHTLFMLRTAHGGRKGAIMKYIKRMAAFLRLFILCFTTTFPAGDTDETASVDRAGHSQGVGYLCVLHTGLPCRWAVQE